MNILCKTDYSFSLNLENSAVILIYFILYPYLLGSLYQKLHINFFIYESYLILI